MGEAICKANASELGRIGSAIRWQRYREQKIAAENADQDEASRKLSCGESFRETAKLRARNHIERLQARIDDLLDRKELDVRAMRDLAEAVLKLEQVEQRLSGRPLPGTLRPTSKPSRRNQDLPSPEPSSD